MITPSQALCLVLACTPAACGDFTEGGSHRTTYENSRYAESWWLPRREICVVTHAGEGSLDAAKASFESYVLPARGSGFSGRLYGGSVLGEDDPEVDVDDDAGARKYLAIREMFFATPQENDAAAGRSRRDSPGPCRWVMWVDPDSVLTSAGVTPGFIADIVRPRRTWEAPSVDVIMPGRTTAAAPAPLSSFLVRNDVAGRMLLDVALALVPRYAAAGRAADEAFRDRIAAEESRPTAHGGTSAPPRLRVRAVDPHSLGAVHRLDASDAPGIDEPAWRPRDWLAHVRGGSLAARIAAMRRLHRGAAGDGQAP